MDPILDLIDHGLISVMRMPEKGKSNQLTWLSQTFHPSTVSGHELLGFHFEVFGRQTSGMTANQVATFTNDEITKDLLRAQVQPAFMENYRRFVVIKATSEDAIPFDKDGVSLPLFILAIPVDCTFSWNGHHSRGSALKMTTFCCNYCPHIPD